MIAPPAAGAAVRKRRELQRQLGEVTEAQQQLEREYSALLAQIMDDRAANRACLELARRLDECFGRGWRLLSPEGVAQAPPAGWRAVAARTTRHIS